MKRHVQQTGVRKYYGDDLIELQSEPLKALEAFFAEYGACILQGCEITESGGGTYDVAAGLVALEADDPQGVRRVMAMPFAGAQGVSLPLYLTAQSQTISRAYGNGEVKPIAYAYAAQAVGVQPAEGTPYLTLTTGGGNRFVDAMQDALHRFITDAERRGWNEKLNSSDYTAVDVLAKLLTVDGKGSGLAADTIADQNGTSVLKLWRGTESAYNALPAKDANTLYITTK